MAPSLLANPIHLFIDASVFLSFYSITNDELEELQKIVDLLDSERLILYVHNHLIDEVMRNRENKLAAALSELRKTEPRMPTVPRFMNDYKEAKELRLSVQEARRLFKICADRGRAEAISSTTAADKLLNSIFSAAHVRNVEAAVIERAETRLKLGNPPGKDKQLGDRIQWEFLLRVLPFGSDLNIITRDLDFCSDLDEGAIHPFIRNEARIMRGSNVFVHRELKRFLAHHFKEFDFENYRLLKKRDDTQKFDRVSAALLSNQQMQSKIEAMQQLRDARNEDDLVNAIDRLKALSPQLNDSDVTRIFEIALSASLVDEYALDEFVHEFFEGLLPRAFAVLNEQQIRAVGQMFGIDLGEELREISQTGDEIEEIEHERQLLDLEAYDNLEPS